MTEDDIDMIILEVEHKKRQKVPSIYELMTIFPTAIGTAKRCISEDIRLLKIAIECNEIDEDPFGSGEELKRHLG